MAIRVLDAFTSLSKKRNKLAHGFFGIVTDRNNQFRVAGGELGCETDGTRFLLSQHAAFI
jgi:hypothetical protein